ncbi:MAG: ATP-binding protein [Thermoplasmataceae archaeon]
MEDIIPPVYAGIIDDIGRKQYSGNVTWLREYIQNAIDSGSNTIHISLKDNDLEVFDEGKGMDRDVLKNQAFSIGNSFKSDEEIGELGIGMYAGSGICDKISVRTKMKEKKVYVATVDMKLYREILRNSPETTFYEAMRKIFQIQEMEDNENGHDIADSFTRIRFEGLSRDTLKLIEEANIEKFLEDTVNLPLSDDFKHRDSVEAFTKGYARIINVTLETAEQNREIKKFKPGSIDFTDTFWSRDIKDSMGRLIGKIWASYNKSGAALDNARILVKRKGLTVGDETYIVSKFNAKYSPRFFGEILVLDNSIEINTSRDWFISSDSLQRFVSKTREALNELFGIADFDSKNGIRIVTLIKSNEKLEGQVKKNEEEGSMRQSASKRDTMLANAEKIKKKLDKAQQFKQRADDGKIDLSNPTNKMKLEIVERTLSSPEVKDFLQKQKPPESTAEESKPKRVTFPQAVRTFLTQNIIDSELSSRIGSGDAKDTTSRAFTFIEQKLKKKVGKAENERCEWRTELLPLFKKKYRPPDYRGFDLEDHMQAFTQIMEGFYTFLRNPSDHTFMDDMNNSRNVFEIIMITDFLVNWIDQWKEKDKFGS